MKLLIIEDDNHKYQDLIRIIRKISTLIVVKHYSSVQEGVVDLLENSYDLMILDMALPTFGSSGGTAQPQGGLELIRTLHATNNTSKVVILTQYPDIEIEGKFIPITHCVETLNKRYDCDVVEAIKYEYRQEDWVKKISLVIGGVYESISR